MGTGGEKVATKSFILEKNLAAKLKKNNFG
jgi:hypothetical protein